jgi:Proteasome subunit
MTAIIGILCQDGVVIGTDSSATFSSGRINTIEQPTEKLHIVGNSIIIAGTGEVGLGQRFQNIVENSWSAGVFKKHELEIVKHLSKITIEDFASTHATQGAYGALIAFPAGNKFHLCEFAISNFQPEFKTKALWYVSLGITQHITDSFLALMRELFWQSGPPRINDGIFAATWALDHAVDVNSGGVNRPIRVSVLCANPEGKLVVAVLPDEVLDEHRQNIKGAKEAVRDYCKNLHKSPDKETPDIPRL